MHNPALTFVAPGLSLLRCIAASLLCFSFLLISPSHSAEIMSFKAWAGNQRGEPDVIAELHLPSGEASRLPVIITQHGSTQDKPFKSGKGRTDVYSQQIIDKGLLAGFAVIAIDAFYPRNTSPNAKESFPAARF